MALNDVTDVSRAERVLAWGEMARQVAHEIKNPLTPMRLGMQHLRRVYRDRRGEFDQTLERHPNGSWPRSIGSTPSLARSAGSPRRRPGPAARPDRSERSSRRSGSALSPGGEGCEVQFAAEPQAVGAARVDEVKGGGGELARERPDRGSQGGPGDGGARPHSGGGRRSGIPADLLPRVFEPRFSTTTSGSGLGLAIVRRLVESWGGFEVESETGAGNGGDGTAAGLRAYLPIARARSVSAIARTCS